MGSSLALVFVLILSIVMLITRQRLAMAQKGRRRGLDWNKKTGQDEKNTQTLTGLVERIKMAEATTCESSRRYFIIRLFDSIQRTGRKWATNDWRWSLGSRRPG